MTSTSGPSSNGGKRPTFGLPGRFTDRWTASSDAEAADAEPEAAGQEDTAPSAGQEDTAPSAGQEDTAPPPGQHATPSPAAQSVVVPAEGPLGGAAEAGPAAGLAHGADGLAPGAGDDPADVPGSPQGEKSATPSLHDLRPGDASRLDPSSVDSTASPDASGVAPTEPLTSSAAPTSQSRPETQTRRGPDGGPRVIAVANQKGGVGKTTTTVNLGAAAAELGHRVLIVDLDPQGNASTGLGINPRSLEASMYDVLLHDVPIDEAIEAAEVRNLFVAPANLDLAGAEIELVPAFSRELRLKNAIADVADDFDLVFIDCPPSLGLLTVNAFAAAGEVLVPIQCEYYALEGLGQLLRNIDLVKRNLNASLELSAIVLVMYDARTNLAAQVADEVREHFGSKVCRAVIPRNIRLSEAPSFGQPITVFDPSSRGAIAYRDLAKEVAGESP